MAGVMRKHLAVARTVVQRLQRNNMKQVHRHRFSHPDTKGPEKKLFERLYVKGRQYMERENFPQEFSTEITKGKIYDSKPFKIELEAGKSYAWCTCGLSKNQPLCDGSHKSSDGTAFTKTAPKFRPHRFKVEETKEYWLCNCKQTDNRPFCDGTHKQDHIQSAIRK